MQSGCNAIQIQTYIPHTPQGAPILDFEKETKSDLPAMTAQA